MQFVQELYKLRLEKHEMSNAMIFQKSFFFFFSLFLSFVFLPIPSTQPPLSPWQLHEKMHSHCEKTYRFIVCQEMKKPGFTDWDEENLAPIRAEISLSLSLHF